MAKKKTWIVGLLSLPLARLRGWLARHSDWRVDGPSRHLGCKSPFLPRFWRYGEARLAIVRDGSESDGPGATLHE